VGVYLGVACSKYEVGGFAFVNDFGVEMEIDGDEMIYLLGVEDSGVSVHVLCIRNKCRKSAIG
jgi:hypothetical protein